MSSPADPSPKTDTVYLTTEEYFEERKLLLGERQRGYQRAEQMVTGGATGALVLSITFLEKLAPRPPVHQAGLLFTAWGILLLGLLASLLSQYFSAWAFDREIGRLEALRDDEPAPANHWNFWTSLTGLVATFSLVIGIPTGIIAAVRVNRWWDSAGKVFALLGLSLPSFWVGLLLILFFSVYLGWLPSSGSGTAAHLLMPAFALGWYFAAAHMRLTRSSMLEVLGSEYVKLARLKGLPEALVISKHAFKNALIPVLTLAGINLVIMVNVAVVVETVFAWPGIGRLMYEGIAFRDFPVVQATVLLNGAMVVIVSLIVDVLYAVIDPRIRFAR